MKRIKEIYEYLDKEYPLVTIILKSLLIVSIFYTFIDILMVGSFKYTFFRNTEKEIEEVKETYSMYEEYYEVSKDLIEEFYTEDLEDNIDYRVMKYFSQRIDSIDLKIQELSK